MTLDERFTEHKHACRIGFGVDEVAELSILSTKVIKKHVVTS